MDLWSCYPDLNWGPHPYQLPLGCFLLLSPIVSYRRKPAWYWRLQVFPLVSCCNFLRPFGCAFNLYVAPFVAPKNGGYTRGGYALPHLGRVSSLNTEKIKKSFQDNREGQGNTPPALWSLFVILSM